MQARATTFGTRSHLPRSRFPFGATCQRGCRAVGYTLTGAGATASTRKRHCRQPSGSSDMVPGTVSGHLASTSFTESLGPR
eukprot:4205394-Lingulodinium_polyedra.AAC.1